MKKQYHEVVKTNDSYHNRGETAKFDMAYVDPLEVGSFVSYKFGFKHRYKDNESGRPYAPEFDGTVSFSDCTRAIRWEFGQYNGNIDKIDAAIKLLQKAKDAYSEVARLHNIDHKLFKVELARFEEAEKLKNESKPKAVSAYPHGVV